MHDEEPIVIKPVIETLVKDYDLDRIADMIPYISWIIPEKTTPRDAAHLVKTGRTVRLMDANGNPDYFIDKTAILHGIVRWMEHFRTFSIENGHVDLDGISLETADTIISFGVGRY